jgi:hypothetical protein
MIRTYPAYQMISVRQDIQEHGARQLSCRKKRNDQLEGSTEEVPLSGKSKKLAELREKMGEKHAKKGSGEERRRRHARMSSSSARHLLQRHLPVLLRVTTSVAVAGRDFKETRLPIRLATGGHLPTTTLSSDASCIHLPPFLPIKFRFIC